MKTKMPLVAVAFCCIASNLRAQQLAPPPLTFDDKGAKLGEQLPDLPLTTLDNHPATLAARIYSRPTLFVTCSYTCPKSRSTFPALAALSAKYADDVDVVIIYVIEAHPAGDPSPYRDGKEDVTDQNKQDNILLRQPQKLDRRLEYANQFKTRLDAKMNILVDGMDNLAWKSLGAGPNMAVLVDGNRTVIARQGWFDAPSLETQIQIALKAAKSAAPAPSTQPSDDLFGVFATIADRDLAAQLIKEQEAEKISIERWFASQPEARQRSLLDKYPTLLHFTEPYSVRGNSGGDTLLQFAVTKKNTALVKLLLEKGADPELPTEHKLLALHQAVSDGSIEILQLLLPHIRHIDLRPDNGPTALQLALLKNHPDAAALLVKAGAAENVFTHAARGDLQAVKPLLAADPSIAWRPDGSGNNPLVYAAANGQLEMCKLLVTTGALPANPDGRDADPLKCAIAMKHLEAAQWLIEAGADARNTILDGANSGDPKMVQMLLKHGALRDLEDTSGWNALHQAAILGNIEVMKVLLDAGIPVNKETGFLRGGCGPPGDYSDMTTPLLLAAIGKHPQAVQFLISQGADITASNIGRETALHYALSILPEDNSANVDATVKVLIDAKVPLNEEDSAGKTALDYAVSAKQSGAEKLLRDAGTKLGSGKGRGDKPQKSDKN